MADDDTAEHMLIQMAADQAELDADFSFYECGEDLLSNLRNIAHPNDLPQIIILDLRMPGLDGYATLDQLHGDPALWAIPVVVLTSSAREAERSLSLSRGASLFQEKPEDFSKLVSLARGLPLLAICWDGAITSNR
ncbi:MAG: response regulator [Actinomycetia bacterium]|nr:response regulator [Actinomycetes bacterium]